ncbi:MAG: tRNA dihydrouridine synthase DusB [Elusimicrobiales bacterium]|nr:tRNA dihydrouridine synthase DusB [Elusimicrobiales bacterium]
MIIKPIKIGSLELKNNLFLSPMAGITNSAFRCFCLEGGAGLVASEMVSSASLKYASTKSFEMLKVLPSEHPVAVQIFGSEPDVMADAAVYAEKAGADIVDINASCPVKKILRSGSGAMLMKDPLLMADIITAIKKKVKIPVTIKFRVGFTDKENLSVELARVAEESGADAIAVHGRPVSRMHNGRINLDFLHEAASAVKAPLIGNGGIVSAKTAKEMLEAGCDAVSIGRAAVGNPRIFSEIIAELNGKAPEYTGDLDKVKMLNRFIILNSELYGEIYGVIRARKLVGYWLKGLKGGAELRKRFMFAKNLNEAKTLLLQYIEKGIL